MLNLAVIMCVFVRSYFISGRLGMLLSGLWLRIFLVQGRCGQKDPRKLPTNCLGRSWRILGVSRTVCITYKCSIGLRRRENDVVGLVPVRECGGKDQVS